MKTIKTKPETPEIGRCEKHGDYEFRYMPFGKRIFVSDYCAVCANEKSAEEKLAEEIPHQEKLKRAIQLITLEAMEQGLNHKVFTEIEYQDLIGTISEVDFQKEQVQYLRGRVEKQDEVLKKLVNQVSERNYIEAKEKGFDTK